MQTTTFLLLFGNAPVDTGMIQAQDVSMRFFTSVDVRRHFREYALVCSEEKRVKGRIQLIRSLFGAKKVFPP